MSEVPGAVPPGLLAEYFSSIRPLVSVICISYNHERFIEASLRSVLKQTYPAVELIVVDNASADATVEKIEGLLRESPGIQLIRNTSNAGICRAFNQGLERARGKYVIDLSADDILYPERIARQVAAFDRLPGDYAVVFGNAAFIDENDRLLGYHFPVDAALQATVPVPTGWVFREILRSYFVCTPTMMMRKDVLDSLGGYDESLSYEDFDFWVRTARDYRYHYQDDVLTAKRLLSSSLSGQFRQAGNALLDSTLAVCYKAFDQCQTAEEYRALAGRIRWFIRQCFYSHQYELAFKFRELLEFMEPPGWQTSLVLQCCRWRIPVNGLYQRYSRWQESRRTPVRLEV
ncbi:glycosyltransferase [Larkinella soli]|uniref:glycosyltransferase n=1 Tax=Larkinella soli TaxID=1770527 RepID=UPI000FFBDCCA|nr:glycosyltransferase [Larkinella soli]